MYCSEYVLDLLEADRKFLLFAHHQEVLDAVEEAVHENVFINECIHYLYILCD